jgi:hypothetical protein
MRSSIWLLALPLAVGCVSADTEEDSLDEIPEAPWGGKADSSRIYVSAESVAALGGDLSSLSPPCRTADAFHTCEYYLSSGSALGDYGPLGAYGPLGTLGPLGTNAWSPSYWISGAFDWSEWSAESTDGPLSADGPLGPDGPLGDEAYYVTLPSINDWAKQLQGGGVWTSLGPLGPLGPLGALGPLGPVGAHGYRADGSGRYTSGSTIKRTISTSYEPYTFELFEMYDEATAKSYAPNDTSFVALGELPRGSVDRFDIKSRHDQFVTIVVVPEKQLDNFDITIRSPEGQVLATSRTSSYIDWVQLQAPRGGRMTVDVSLAASGHFLSKTYRLYVVGSGENFSQTDIRGRHQRSL